MTFVTLDAHLVDQLHDGVLNPGELTGHAMNKSLDGALGRVENRLLYGMINDVYDLAAAYAVSIATGHVFNDGNKRTAYQVMDICLALNGVSIGWHGTDVADVIIELAQGLIDADDLARWLRAKA